jgi:glycosyltransferase involved in cell wall biosynthesis
MRILEVSRYKNNFVNHQLPFVTEQGEAIYDYLNCGLENGDCKMVNEPSEVEYFLIKGNYLKARKALMAKIREWKPDVIHAHYGLSAIVAEMQSEVPVVTTFHNGETHRWWVNLLSSLFSLRAKHVIYVAQHIYDKVYFKAKHYSIIPCGVSLEDCFLMDKAEARKQLNWDAKKKYIMFGGAFDNTRKNYTLLKEAVERIGSDIEIIEMRGLSREQCVLRMNACDVFALPTKNEGSPQALKEAMACNCPVVATDVADIKHLLGGLPGHYVLPNKKGNAAWWVGDESSVEKMVVLIRQALEFEGRTKGRERIVELGYTNELVAKQIVRIYEEILKQ